MHGIGTAQDCNTFACQEEIWSVMVLTNSKSKQKLQILKGSHEAMTQVNANKSLSS